MIPPRIFFELGSTGLVFFGVWLAWKHWARVGWKSLAGWYLVRLAATAVVAFVAGKSVNFDLEVWVRHGQWMVAGNVPGIDFQTPYSYGFNMLLKLCALPNGTQFQVMALFMLAEWLALGILYAVLRDLRDEKTAKRSVILYLTSPIYVPVACCWAQDETLCLLAVASMLWCATRRNEWVAVVGMALTAGLGLFFTKILVIYYLVPFLFLRRWKGAVASILMFALYFAVVKACGINPFCFAYGRELGMSPEMGENVLEFLTSGNLWSVMGKPVPHDVSGVVCCAVLIVSGSLSLPSFLRQEMTVRDRFDTGVEWTCVWIFVFNIFYSMTFVPYILPVVPFLALFILDRVEKRAVLFAGGILFAAWMGLKLVDAYVRWFMNWDAAHAQALALCSLFLGVLVLLGSVRFYDRLTLSS